MNYFRTNSSNSSTNHGRNGEYPLTTEYRQETVVTLTFSFEDMKWHFYSISSNHYYQYLNF